MAPSNKGGPGEDVRNRVNQILRGWLAYFSYGTEVATYEAVDSNVPGEQKVRAFKGSGPGRASPNRRAPRTSGRG